jgi:hypothetical protein
MAKKLLDILASFVVGLKDGLVEPVRNLVFDIKYDLLTKEDYSDLTVEDYKEEKPKKKKKSSKKKLK